MEIIKDISFGIEKPSDIDYRMQLDGFADVWLYDNIRKTEDGYIADGVNFKSKLTADEILRQKDLYFNTVEINNTDTSIEDLKKEIEYQRNIIDLLIEKQGYSVHNIGNGVSELVLNDSDELPVGDYLNPITYTVGMEVEQGKFYTMSDDDNIWEFIKNGTPKNFSDKGYFDIIEV